jgi:ATP-binding cassette, subfamily C (CFTR/MRP), member 1
MALIQLVWLFYVVARLSILTARLAYWRGLFIGVPPLANGIVMFCLAASLSWLSYLEHIRSEKPSDFIASYLLVSCIEDVVLMIDHRYPGPLVFPIQFLLKIVLLILESWGKSSLLIEKDSQLSPQDRAGIINRAFLWWTRDILILGYSKILSNDDIPPIDAGLSAERLRTEAVEAWEKRGRHIKSTLLANLTDNQFNR